MKVLFLSTYPLEKGPSQRFRIGLYLPELDKEGIQYHYIPFYSEKAWEILFEKGNFLQKALRITSGYMRRFKLLLQVGKWDVIFIQREVSPIGPPIFAWIASKVFRKRLIFDLDDAIWLPNYSDENAFFHRLKTYWKTKYTMRWSDVVVAGNEYLAEYSRQFNDAVRVIPTVVDTQKRHFPSRDRLIDTPVPTIGWTGTTTTLQHIQKLDQLLGDIQKQIQFELRIIANKDPEMKSVQYSFVPWSQENEIQELEKIDIGLMPLPDNQWTKGKCGFKAIQYMSLGIAPIVSPVGVNKTIVSHGVNGYHCSTPESWRTAIIKLLQDKTHRIILGQDGIKAVNQNYSVASQRSKFIALFKSS